MTLWSVAARNTLRNKFRTLMTVAGGAVAILAFLMLRTVLHAWSVGSEYAAKDRLATRDKVSFVIPLPKKYIDQVREIPGVKAATYMNWFGAKLAAYPDEFFANMAMDDNALDVYDEVKVDPAQMAAWNSDKIGAIVGDSLANKFHWKVGDTVVLQGTIFPGDWKFTVDGIYAVPKESAVPRTNFWFHWSYMNDGLPARQKDKIGWIVATINNPSEGPVVSDRIDKLFDDSDTQTTTMSEQALNNSFLGGFSAILQALDLVSIIILVIMMLILGNTIAMGVRERTTEYGVLRALGFQPGHIRSFIVGEALTLSLLSALLGLLLALPLISGMGAWLEENMGQFFPVFRMTPAHGGRGGRAHAGARRAGLAHSRDSRRPDARHRRAAEDRMIPIAYNIRSLTVRRTTTLAAALGLALVVFIFASVMMMSNGIKQVTARAADPSVAIVLRKGSDVELSSGIEESNVNPLIAATPGVAKAANGRPLAVGELLVVVLLDKVGGGFSNVVLRGVPDNVMTFRPTVKIVEGRAATPGTDEAIVGSAIRGRFKGLEIGETFEMRKNRPMKIVGVFEDNGSSFESEIWGDTNVIRSTFGRQGIVSSVRVRLESPAMFDAFKTEVETNRQLNVTAMRDTEFYEKSSHGTALFLSVLGFVIAFFFSIGATIGAMITMHATVAQRQREIGTLRALGFSRFQILFSFLVESIALSLLGGVIGAAASLSAHAGAEADHVDEQRDVVGAVVQVRADAEDHAHGDRHRGRHGHHRRLLPGDSRGADQPGPGHAGRIAGPPPDRDGSADGPITCDDVRRGPGFLPLITSSGQRRGRRTAGRSPIRTASGGAWRGPHSSGRVRWIGGRGS